MSKEEMQQQILDAITSGKIQVTNINFGDHVEHQHKIEKVEAGGVGFQIFEAHNSHSESKQVEDIQPIETHDKLFCRITKAAHDTGKAQQVESELRSACVSAPKLVKAIRTNEALGYLDTQNLSSVDLYDLLNEHFGLTFKQRNFDYYRSK